MNTIDLDVEGIHSLLSKEVFGLKDNEGNYSNEWKTIDCITDAFSNIKDITEKYNSCVLAIQNHLKELEMIATQPAPDIPQLDQIPAKVQIDLKEQGYPSSRDGSLGSKPIVEKHDGEVIQTATVATEHQGLNVRTGKGSNNPIKTSAARGSTVTILEDDGSGWTKVRLEDGTEGYVASKFLNKDKKTTSSIPTRTTKPQNISETPTATPPIQTTKTQSIGETATVTTKDSGLNIRTGKGIGNPVIKSTPKGSQVTIIEEDGSGWTKVRLEDGTEGYVVSKFLSKNQSATGNAGGTPNVSIQNFELNASQDYASSSQKKEQ